MLFFFHIDQTRKKNEHLPDVDNLVVTLVVNVLLPLNLVFSYFSLIRRSHCNALCWHSAKCCVSAYQVGNCLYTKDSMRLGYTAKVYKDGHHLQ